MVNADRAETEATDALRRLREALAAKLSAVDAALAAIAAPGSRPTAPQALPAPAARTSTRLADLRESILPYFPQDGTAVSVGTLLDRLKGDGSTINRHTLANRLNLVLSTTPFRRVAHGRYVFDRSYDEQRTTIEPARSTSLVVSKPTHAGVHKTKGRAASTAPGLRHILHEVVPLEGPMKFGEIVSEARKQGAPGRADTLNGRISQILRKSGDFKQETRGLWRRVS